MKSPPLVAIIFIAEAILLALTMILVQRIGFAEVDGQKKMESDLVSINHLYALGSTVKDAETGERGYLLTGDKTYLAPYNAALTRIRAEMADVRTMAKMGLLPGDEIGRAHV